MDRFIVGVFNRSYAMNFNLKSNMDRFIANPFEQLEFLKF